MQTKQKNSRSTVGAAERGKVEKVLTDLLPCLILAHFFPAGKGVQHDF